MFQGNCNYGDQAEVALAYTMTRAKIKSLKGVKVGIAGIAVASGQEWIDTLKAKVEAAGGTAVTQTLPAAIVNADVAAQAFQDAGVKMILMHHSIAGGIAMERSIAKYGINVPVSGSYGVTQDLLWTTAPYDATKNFVGTNCYTPLVDSKTPQGKLALATGKKVRRLGGLARPDELHARLGQRRDHRAGAQEHHGPGHDGLDEEGPRERSRTSTWAISRRR